MYNLQEISVKILNTPPYQLPPIIHTSGVYQLDVKYRDQPFHKVSPHLEECMGGYFDFVVRVNDRFRFRSTDFNKVPVPLGSTMPVKSEYEIEDKEVTNG